MQSTVQRSGFLKGIALLSGGSIIAQFIAFIGTLIASRLYTPDVFGEAAVFISLAYIISVIGCLRYEMAIVLPEKDKDGINILVISLVFLLIVSFISMIALFMYSQPLAKLLNLKKTADYLWLVGISALLIGVMNPFRFWFTRKKDFKINGIRRIITQTGVSTIVVAGGMSGFTSSIHLIVFRMLGFFIGDLYHLYYLIKKYHRIILENVTYKRMLHNVRRYRRFPKYSLPEALLSTTAFYSPALILSIFFNTSIVGKFNLALQLVGMPIELIATAISQVYFQKISEMKYEGNDYRKFTELLYATVIKIVTYPAILLGVIAPGLFSFTVGDIWYEAGVFVGLMIPFMIVKFISIPLMNIYLVEEKQDAGLVFTLFQFIFQLGFLTVGAIFGAPKIAIVLYSISGSIIYLVFCLWLLKVIGSSYFNSLGILFRSVLFSVPFVVLLGILKVFVNVPLIYLISYIAISLFLYFILLIKYDSVVKEMYSKSIMLIKEKFLNK